MPELILRPKSLLNCAPCASLRLRALPIIVTHYTCLHAFAPLHFSISALCAFVWSCYKYHCVCRPPRRKVWYSKKQPWTHAKMRFFSFRLETPFLVKFGPKNQNCWPKLKFGIQTYSNIRNSMVMFTFSVFDQEYPFGVNLVQKIKIVSLSWNLVSILIWICKIQWRCSLFLFSTENTFL